MNKKNTPRGLSDLEVEQSRKKFGKNVDSSHNFTTEKLLFKTLFSIFNIVMASLIVILYMIGQKNIGQFIGIIAAINTTVELVQIIRARLIIKNLNKLIQKTVTIVRNGQKKEIPIEDLVINDVIFISSGDRVPVDGKVVFSEYAEFDESILTGESKYIEKKNDNGIKAGSFVTAGNCFYKATSFSKDSYIQKLTKQVSNQELRESPLRSQINQIIKVLTYMTIFFIGLLVLEGIVQENQKEEIIINVSVLVISLVPQGLVLITTLSFAYGAIRIARNQAVVQKLSAIEAMANIKIACMDKTGTLTKNILEVHKIKWL